MDTFEINVQFYRQIEKFTEQLHSGTEHKENIFFIWNTLFSKRTILHRKRRHKHCNRDGIGNLHLQGK